MPKRRRSRPLRRRGVEQRTPKKLIIISCEGQTEREYFEALRQEYRAAAVKVLHQRNKTAPSQVVAHLDTQSKPGAECWAAFDRDEHVCFDRAFKEATRKGRRVAWSNPCFELWAILHFQDQSAEIRCDALQRELPTHLAGYDHRKGARLDLAKMKHALGKARTRAFRLNARTSEARGCAANPSTTVWMLVDAIIHGSTEAARDYARSQEDGSLGAWDSLPPPE